MTRVRPHGNPVRCKTVDLGAGGMRVSADRPLQVDEMLDFDLVLDDSEHVSGQCRVLREQFSNCYALRFEYLPAPAAASLTRLVGTRAL